MTTTQIDQYEKELSAFKKGANITYQMEQKFAILKYDIFTFKLNFPRTNNDYFVVEVLNNENEMDWIDDLNILSIERKFSLTKILTIIHNKVQKLNASTSQTDQNIIGSNITITDMMLHKKKKELESFIETSRSPIVSNTLNASQLFNKRTVCMIVIDEFLTAWKYIQRSDKMTLELVNNNLFHWKLKLMKFSRSDINQELLELKKKFGYNYIEIELMFHDVLYPNYPPSIKVIRPRMNNALMHKLANAKMVKLNYWKPTRDSLFIINKIYDILNQKGSIFIDTDMNNTNKYKDGAYLSLESHLVKLASYVNINTDNDDDLDNEKYEQTFNISKKEDTKTANKKHNTGWAPGTGYGGGGTSVWNVDAYIKSQEEQDRQIKNILSQIIIEIQDITTNHDLVYNTIKHSYLIPYVKSMLDGITLLEMSKHQEVYNIIFNLLGNIANEHGIYLFENI